MRRIFIFEPECAGSSGHALFALKQFSNFFKKKLKVFCITSKHLNKKNFFPEAKILNIIHFNEGDFKFKNIFKFIKILFFFIYKIFIFFSLAMKKKNFLFSTLCKIKFIPRYLPDFYNLILTKRISNNDIVFVPSGRPHILQFLVFLFFFDKKNFPEIHFRIVHPIKYRGKKDNFYKYLEMIFKEKVINKKFFFYAENQFNKKTLEKFHNLEAVIFNGISLNQKNKKIQSNLVISFLGDSKIYKGFNKIPNLLKILQATKFSNRIKFIIQISNFDLKIKSSILEIKKIATKFNNISLIEGPINNNEFNKYLKNTDIMPLLHPINRAKTFGSGFIYSCVGSEIILIIPQGVENWKNRIPGKSFLEARTVKDYAAKIQFIIKNINYYKELAKFTKKNYLKNLSKNKLIRRLMYNDY